MILSCQVLTRSHLDGHERDHPVEETDNVQKTTGYVFSNNHGGVFILRITFPFNIPIFYGANNMAFVGGAELDLNLVSPSRLSILEQEVRRPALG